MLSARRYGHKVTPEEAVELGRLLTATVERIDQQSGKYDVSDFLVDVWSSCNASVEVLKGHLRYGGIDLPIGGGGVLFLRIDHYNHQYKGAPFGKWQLASCDSRGRYKSAGIKFDGNRVSHHLVRNRYFQKNYIEHRVCRHAPLDRLCSVWESCCLVYPRTECSLWRTTCPICRRSNSTKASKGMKVDVARH